MKQRILNNEQGQDILNHFGGIADAFVNKTFLHSKTVTPTTSQQVIEPDANYQGLSSVTVSAVSLQEKTVTPTTTQQIITPDNGYLGLSKVTVNASSGGGTPVETITLTLYVLNWEGAAPPYRYDLGASFANKHCVVGLNGENLSDTDIELIGKFMITGGESGRYLYANQWHPSVDIEVIIQYAEEAS